MTKENTIYVGIQKAGIERLTPVAAIPLAGDMFQITPQPYDRLSEKWEFPPGTIVRCHAFLLGHREVLVADELANLSAQSLSQ